MHDLPQGEEPRALPAVVPVGARPARGHLYRLPRCRVRGLRRLHARRGPNRHPGDSEGLRRSHEEEAAQVQASYHATAGEILESAFPDLLTFHDAPTPIEQTLFKMHLEYRQRLFQGAFHNNPDYSLWYGWSEMQQALAEIKHTAAELREG